MPKKATIKAKAEDAASIEVSIPRLIPILSRRKNVNLTIDSIQADLSANVREWYNLEPLKADLVIRGQLVPILVFRKGGKITVCRGHRRLLAFKELHEQFLRDNPKAKPISSPWYEINADDVGEVNDPQTIAALYADAANRQGAMTTWEECLAVRNLRDQGIPQEECGTILGVSRGWIVNRLNFLALPDAVQTLYREHELAKLKGDKEAAKVGFPVDWRAVKFLSRSFKAENGFEVRLEKGEELRPFDELWAETVETKGENWKEAASNSKLVSWKVAEEIRLEIATKATEATKPMLLALCDAFMQKPGAAQSRAHFRTFIK